MPSFLLAATEESSGGLIDVVPGLMIWTLIAFAITFFVLKKFAFGPIQKTIDDRRDRIQRRSRRDVSAGRPDGDRGCLLASHQ